MSARAGASEADVEAIVAERIRRHQIRLVVGEAALYSAPKTTEALRGQLDRLLTVAGLASMELGVLPMRVHHARPHDGRLAIHDDAAVHVETLISEQRLEESGEVSGYRQVFQELQRDAASGDEALRLIRAALVDGG